MNPLRSGRSDRRRFIARGLGLAGALAVGAPFDGRAALANARRSDGPYGPLGPPDTYGVRVPAGFTSRLVARTGDLVGRSDYRWHEQPDGGACFSTSNGGFVYVSNSEIGNGGGGAGAVRFDQRGTVRDAYRVLDETSRNCSGGSTPWGTWLSCEENGVQGEVWECDPEGRPETARRWPALGHFNHEAVEVVASQQRLYLTEDSPQGRLYRFIPDVWPRLEAGRLQAAAVDASGGVTWEAVADDEPARSETTTVFNGGEGLAHWNDSLFIATKGDKRLWRYDMELDRIEVLHDCIAQPDTELDSVDNLFVHPRNGDLYVAEDGPSVQLCTMVTDEAGGSEIAPVVEFVGHDGSEVAGPSLDPIGDTMLVSSQRGRDGRGMTFAVTGPFRGRSERPPIDSEYASIDGLRGARRISLD